MSRESHSDRSHQQPLHLVVGVESLVGRQRQANEDSYAVFAPGEAPAERKGLDGLLLVADGMGGALAGEVASQLATEAIRSWAGALETEGLRGDQPGAAERAASTLEETIAQAHRTILDYGDSHPEAAGLGTTLVLAALVGEQWVIAHLGDSRCYRVRDGVVEQMTLDHSWVEQQVQAGVLAREEADAHPQSHVLTRSLGSTTSDKPELRIEPAMAGDLLILCSDGLSGSVREDDLAAVADERDLEQLTRRLAHLANDRDGSDNITVVAGRLQTEQDLVGAPAAELPAPGGPTKLRRRVLATAAGATLLVAGYAAGALVTERLSLETRAAALLEQARLDLEAGRQAEAEERLELAEALFVDAPQAVEARRRLSELSEPVQAETTEPVVDEPQPIAVDETSAEAIDADDPAADEGAVVTTDSEASAPEGDEAETSEAARAEARAAEKPGSDTSDSDPR